MDRVPGLLARCTMKLAGGPQTDRTMHLKALFYTMPSIYLFEKLLIKKFNPGMS